ncbi:AAA-ATPase ASD, mitochondrial-like [Nicotiana tomentosiformis]|uniref:AAA-ATPase ASD, mitochondrial-like n=1 Tax=Nicotiana tomentosiformis TaxID=4098 RepID=UPI00051B57F3|nr:AAA-ATPase ASD, mitochondrial-like [Nicotiana tomentosiformis]
MISTMGLLQSWGGLGTSIASFIFMWDMIRRYCPPELIRASDKWTRRIRSFFYPFIQISISEFMSNNLKPHDAYAAVEAYLSVHLAKEAKKLRAETVHGGGKLVLSMDEHERVTDEFGGAKIQWISGKIVQRESKYLPEVERKYYKVTFHKKYRDMVTDTYLEHVIKTGKEIQMRNRKRKLYTNGHNKTTWSHIVFEHPATFDSLAMEAEKKREIVDDLLMFRESKDFYARIGKAWKRGYLLYGPPGTGKSTMIAAMANLLDYDVYDLELTSVRDNTELRRLLAETSSKSIIVIEDIDCSLDLTGQRKKKQEKPPEEKTSKTKKEVPRKDTEESGSRVTLSGLLNFIDGLWSACSGERIIVFTTNYVDKLDPALTRRGRMDKHIELSYCSFEGFKVLAKNYLLLDEHPLFEPIEMLMKETKIIPADVAESLMPSSPKEDAGKCLLKLIDALKQAKEMMIKKGKEESADKEVPEMKEDADVLQDMEDSADSLDGFTQN